MNAKALPLLTLSAALLVSAGCRQNMHNQRKIEPYEANPFFADGQGSRPLPAGTVARGELREGSAYTGLDPATTLPIAELPMPVTPGLIRRGQERYDIFCSPCHSRVGDGRGMIVRRGYKQPSSFHIERLRTAPVGYFFNVMTEGFGVMPSYAPQIPVEDRWAIAAYMRALQFSQGARLAELPPGARARVEAELAGAAPLSPSPISPGTTRLPAPGTREGRPDPNEVSHE